MLMFHSKLLNHHRANSHYNSLHYLDTYQLSNILYDWWIRTKQILWHSQCGWKIHRISPPQNRCDLTSRDSTGSRGHDWDMGSTPSFFWGRNNWNMDWNMKNCGFNKEDDGHVTCGTRYTQWGGQWLLWIWICLRGANITNHVPYRFFTLWISHWVNSSKSPWVTLRYLKQTQVQHTHHMVVNYYKKC